MRKLSAIAVSLSLATTFCKPLNAAPQQPANPTKSQLPQRAPDATCEMTLPLVIDWNREAQITHFTASDASLRLSGDARPPIHDLVISEKPNSKTWVQTHFSLTPNGTQMLISGEGRVKVSWWRQDTAKE